MLSTRVVLTSIALLSLVGCATQNDLDAVRRDSDEMKSRIFTLDKSLGEIRGEVKEGIDKNLTGYKQNLEALHKEMEGYQAEMATLRKGSADLQATLETARVDMQVLTGKVDDVRLLAQKPADDVALLKEDNSKRMAALDERLGRMEKSVTELLKKLTELQQVQQQQQQQQQQSLQQLKQLQQSPEYLYQQGLEAMKTAGGGGKSRELLSKFLELYPKHQLAANAHYWIGETYYSEKNYEQAILEFQEVIKNFPEKDKAPAALLKQGMAFRELGDAKSAQYDFKKVIEEYPHSKEAKSAKEKLRER